MRSSTTSIDALHTARNGATTCYQKQRLMTPPPLTGHGAPDADVVIAEFFPLLPWCSNSSGCGFPMSVLQFPYSSRRASWGYPSLVGGSRGADTVGNSPRHD